MRNGTQFTSNNQPSGIAKSQGWDRRRERLELMNSIKDLLQMNYSDFLKMRKDIESKPQEYTVKDKMLIDYLSNDKYIIDWLDRLLGKATQQIDLESTGDKPMNYTLEIINKIEDVDREQVT